jgi:hypothetical protein
MLLWINKPFVYCADETELLIENQSKVVTVCPEAPFLETKRTYCNSKLIKSVSLQGAMYVLIMVCSHVAFPGIANTNCAGIAPLLAMPVEALEKKRHAAENHKQ